MSQGINRDGTVKRPPRTKSATSHLPRGKSVQVQEDGRPTIAGITVEKYNEMTEAFFKEQAVEFVARSSRVKWHTARKYIEKGDPKRGLRPIRERFIESQKAVQKKHDRTWQDAKLESLEMVRAQKALLTKALNRLASNQAEQDSYITQANKDPKTLSDTISKVVRDESFLFGEADSRVDVLQGIQAKVEEWSPEELDEFISTGKRPDRLVGALTSGGTKKGEG